MQYAKIIGNGVLFKSKPTSGYKPVKETTPENRDGFTPVSHYEDRGESIIAVWEYVKNREIFQLTDEEALTRYANSLTGANDPDLISAAETLITERIKEDM